MIAKAIYLEDLVSFSIPGKKNPFLANSSYVISNISTKPAFLATACEAPAVNTVAVTLTSRALQRGILKILNFELYLQLQFGELYNLNYKATYYIIYVFCAGVAAEFV